MTPTSPTSRSPQTTRAMTTCGVAVVTVAGFVGMTWRDTHPTCHVSIPAPCVSPDVSVAGSATYAQPVEGHVDPLPYGPLVPDRSTIVPKYS